MASKIGMNLNDEPSDISSTLGQPGAAIKSVHPRTKCSRP